MYIDVELFSYKSKKNDCMLTKVQHLDWFHPR